MRTSSAPPMWTTQSSEGAGLGARVAGAGRSGEPPCARKSTGSHGSRVVTDTGTCSASTPEASAVQTSRRAWVTAMFLPAAP